MENEDALRRLAERQYAMVSRQQAAEAGVSWEALRSRLHAGTWAAVTGRVVRLMGSPAHPLDGLMAATLDGGPGTVVNRRSGAVLWEVPGFVPGPVQVSRLRGSSARRPPSGQLLLLRYLPEHLTTELHGIPTVTLPFLLYQLAEANDPTVSTGP